MNFHVDLSRQTNEVRKKVFEKLCPKGTECSLSKLLNDINCDYMIFESDKWFIGQYHNLPFNSDDITGQVLREAGVTEPEQEKGKKYDTGKPMYNLIPVNAESELVDVLTFGAEKYGPNNWRNIDNLTDRYIAATMRHLASYRKGEKIDRESGKHHLAHAMCCLAFILENDLTDEDRG